MDVVALHPWDLSPKEAMRLQSQLASRVIREGELPDARVRFIAGADVAFDRPNARGAGALVVLAYPSLEVVDSVTAEAPVTFPYVPGLLSFRETPVLLRAFERLQQPPDLLIVDGHGYAHPRRFGFACHLGLLLDIPTIGVAKSRLLGEAGTVAPPRGARSDLTDRGEIIGSLLRTKEKVRPIYVSIGHRISLPAAERWALACAPKYRVPEPTRLADRLAGEAKRHMLDATLEMIVEQREGEPGRWEWDAGAADVIYRHDLEPMLTHYGCSSELICRGDNELLDIMLVDDEPRDRGERLNVRVIDMLERGDGDHKLLAIPAIADRDAIARRLPRLRDRIFAWYVALEKPVTRWTGEEQALAYVRSLREGGVRG